MASERNIIRLGGYCLQPLDNFADVSEFDCAADDVNEFLKCGMARKYQEQLIGVTYVLRRDADFTSPTEVFAFATLMNDAVVLDYSVPSKDTPSESVDVFPFYPAVKIGRMGVNVQYQRMGLGSLVISMLQQMFIVDNRAGCRLITVDTNRNSASFFERNGFIALPSLANDDSDYLCLVYDLLWRFHA